MICPASLVVPGVCGGDGKPRTDMSCAVVLPQVPRRVLSISPFAAVTIHLP